MSYRYMRMILFFDLPTETSQERREYTRFRKYLLKSGFMMMQESVYCKIALNQTVVNSLYDSLQNRARDLYRCSPSRKSSFPKWNLYSESITAIL